MVLLEFQERMIMEEECSSVLKEDCVDNTQFEQKSLRKYTRVVRDQDGLKVKSIIDVVLVNRDMLYYAQDIRAVKGMG